jgi:mono/diheme cytochrome c family protein
LRFWPAAGYVGAALIVVGFGLVLYIGSQAGAPTEIDIDTPSELEPGKLVAAQSGCLACHRIGGNGNDGPGQELTHIGARLSAAEIRRALAVGPDIMPSYDALPPRKTDDLVNFLASLN